MATDSVAHRESTGQQGCPDAPAGRVIDAETRARMDAISAATTAAGKNFAKKFDEAVDRVIARVRAAAALAAAAARLRHQAATALGVITAAARRSTSHGGRASQARGDDSDPADAPSSGRLTAALSTCNQADPACTGSAFCVSRRTRKW